MDFAVLIDGDDRDPGCETSHGLTEVIRGEAHVETCTTLPRQTNRKLNLTWVEYRAGRSVRRIGRALPVARRRSDKGTTWRTRIFRAKVRRSITCVEVADVDGVQQVEGLRQELEMQPFMNG